MAMAQHTATITSTANLGRLRTPPQNDQFRIGTAGQTADCTERQTGGSRVTAADQS